MNQNQAQRIRFGILAARHRVERGRLTPWQVDYLEGCRAVGSGAGNDGSVKAFRKEADAALTRKHGHA